MPNNRKPHPLYGHTIISAIIVPSSKINLRRPQLQKGEPLLVTSAEHQLLRSSSALMRLMAHTAKLDHAVYFLSQKGRKNNTENVALTMLGVSGWAEYHLGYFYALHRSTYDVAQWFTCEALNMNLPKNLGLEKKFQAIIQKTDSLVQLFKDLKEECDEFSAARNDHLHRGQYVQASPITGSNEYDQLLVMNTMFNYLRQVAPGKYDAANHQDVQDLIKSGRQMLAMSLRLHVDDLQNLLVRLVNILEPVLREQIRAVEAANKPSP